MPSTDIKIWPTCMCVICLGVCVCVCVCVLVCVVCCVTTKRGSSPPVCACYVCVYVCACMCCWLEDRPTYMCVSCWCVCVRVLVCVVGCVMKRESAHLYVRVLFVNIHIKHMCLSNPYLDLARSLRRALCHINIHIYTYAYIHVHKHAH